MVPTIIHMCMDGDCVTCSWHAWHLPVESTKWSPETRTFTCVFVFGDCRSTSQARDWNWSDWRKELNLNELTNRSVVLLWMLMAMAEGCHCKLCIRRRWHRHGMVHAHAAHFPLPTVAPPSLEILSLVSGIGIVHRGIHCHWSIERSTCKAALRSSLDATEGERWCNFHCIERG